MACHSFSNQPLDMHKATYTINVMENYRQYRYWSAFSENDPVDDIRNKPILHRISYRRQVRLARKNRR